MEHMPVRKTNKTSVYSQTFLSSRAPVVGRFKFKWNTLSLKPHIRKFIFCKNMKNLQKKTRITWCCLCTCQLRKRDRILLMYQLLATAAFLFYELCSGKSGLGIRLSPISFIYECMCFLSALISLDALALLSVGLEQRW